MNTKETSEEEKLRMGFADRLYTLRKRRRLTQKQMAAQLNVSRSTYTSYETGLSTPTLTTLCRMASLFEVTTDYLAGRDDKGVTSGEVLRDLGFDERECRLVERFRAMPENRRKVLFDLMEMLE